MFAAARNRAGYVILGIAVRHDRRYMRTVRERQQHHCAGKTDAELNPHVLRCERFLSTARQY
jgi:hypothetical protein